MDVGGTAREFSETDADSGGLASVSARAAAVPASAGDAADEPDEPDAERLANLCAQLTGAADRHGVPHGFFIRLIWKESRFAPQAVSPVGAQGIAQFMPATARARGLADPFDPDQALPASARFLRDLKNRFGVWGLAAAGYNAGPDRVRSFLAGETGLPYETLDYVFTITGREARYWKLRVARLKAATPAVAAPPPAPGIVVRRPVAVAVPGTLSPHPPARAVPTPRARPEVAPPRVNCRELIAALGRARAAPRLAFGSGGWSPWGAQVAGHLRREIALRQFDRIRGKLPADLQSPTVIVRRFPARGRQPIHAVQFAAPSRAVAEATCRRVAKALAPCVVVKNR